MDVTETDENSLPVSDTSDTIRTAVNRFVGGLYNVSSVNTALVVRTNQSERWSECNCFTASDL